MSSLVVRQAVLSDLELIVPLFDAYRQFYLQPSDLDGARHFLRKRFEHGESTLFLALEGGQAVGFTQLYPLFSSVSLSRYYLLNDLYVRAEGRGKGAGTALLHAAVEYARHLNASGLMLSTAHSNVKAQRVYEAAGWKLDTEYRTYCFDL